MLLVTGLFLQCVVFWTASCTEQTIAILANNNGNSGGLSAMMRGKRGIDVGLLLRNLLMNSAQASSIKTNALVSKTRTPPPSTTARTTTTTTTTMPSAPPNMQNNTAGGTRVGIRGRFQGQIVPWLGFDYLDFDAPISSTSMAPPSRRTTPTPSTTSEPVPATVPPPSRQNPKQQLEMQTMPNLPFYATPAPILRFGNRLYNSPSYMNFDYFQIPNRKIIHRTNDYSDDDYQEYQQQKTQPQQQSQQQHQISGTRQPSQQSSNPPAQVPAPSPRRPPSQLRNKLVYQFAQPEDTSSDEPAPADATNDDIDRDDSFNINTSSNSDANPGDGDNKPAAATIFSGDAGTPRMQQSDLGLDQGSSFIYTPHGSNQFGNQFSDLHTTYDGAYSQPSLFGGQYFFH